MIVIINNNKLDLNLGLWTKNFGVRFFVCVISHVQCDKGTSSLGQGDAK